MQWLLLQELFIYAVRMKLQKTCKNKPNEKKEECYLMPTSNKNSLLKQSKKGKKNKRRL
jgi:hypothetical protein